MQIENDEKNNKRRLSTALRILLYFLFSVALHLIFVGSFFHYGFHKRAASWWQSFTKRMPQQRQADIKKYYQERRQALAQSLQSIKTDKQNNLPARLRAPKSNFGWVMFDEPPQQKQADHKLEIPTTLDGDVGEAQAPVATEGTPVPPEQAKLPTTAHITKPAEPAPLDTLVSAPADPVMVSPVEPRRALGASGTDDTQPVPKQTTEEKKPAASSTPFASSAPEQGAYREERTVAKAEPHAPSREERIAQIRDMQSRVASFEAGKMPSPSQQQLPPVTLPQTQEVRADRLVGGTGGIRVRGARSETETKPQRSIIALTKGFVEKWDGEEGTDLIDRDGDPNKRPSFEELKYLSYEAKINWCLQASWKQNFSQRSSQRVQEGEAVIEFVLDKHGALQSCTLLQTTGFQELDTMIMKNMKFASPFPPLPKHFGTNTYRTGRIIQVRSTKFNF